MFPIVPIVSVCEDEADLELASAAGVACSGGDAVAVEQQ